MLAVVSGFLEASEYYFLIQSRYKVLIRLRFFPIFGYAWIIMIFIKNCLDLILKELLLDNIPTSESRMFKL